MPAFRRQPAPAAAATWFADPAGQMVIASEADVLRAVARECPDQPGLWLQPGVVDMGDIDCLEAPGVRLHAAGAGFAGDIRCGSVLPFANECCGVVVVQHLADISAEPSCLLNECARVLIPGGRLWLLALNPLAPYRLRWQGQGPRAAEPFTWRRRLRAAGLVPDPVSHGIGPTWAIALNPHLQDGAGLRAAFMLRAEKRRIPLTPMRATRKLRLQTGLPAA
ncbi:MAG: methyltransferase domain-containing protein [Thermomonas sp.]